VAVSCFPFFLSRYASACIPECYQSFRCIGKSFPLGVLRTPINWRLEIDTLRILCAEPLHGTFKKLFQIIRVGFGLHTPVDVQKQRNADTVRYLEFSQNLLIGG